MGPAELPDHPAHSRHRADDPAAPRPAHRRERPAADNRAGTGRPGGPGSRLLTSASDLYTSRQRETTRPRGKRVRRQLTAAAPGAILARAMQVLELAGGERRMTPHGLGGAPGEGAGDVHPVRGLQEDDLDSHPLAVEPAAGGGHRDGFAVAIGV